MGLRISSSRWTVALGVILVAMAVAIRLQAASPTPFDGYYTGGVLVPGGQPPQPRSIAFSVINGGLNWQSPGPSTGLVGEVASDGSFSVQIIDAEHGTEDFATLSGTLSINGTGSGTFSTPSPPCGNFCNGTFTVSRVTGPCSETSHDLCVAHEGDHPFDITVHYFTSQSGGADSDATAVSINCSGVTKGGAFAFSDNSNPEVLVKVLNGCSINNAYWVFITAATNQGFNVVVRDTVTGAVVTYSNPDLHAATPIQDIAALPCS